MDALRARNANDHEAILGRIGNAVGMPQAQQQYDTAPMPQSLGAAMVLSEQLCGTLEKNLSELEHALIGDCAEASPQPGMPAGADATGRAIRLSMCLAVLNCKVNTLLSALSR